MVIGIIIGLVIGIVIGVWLVADTSGGRSGLPTNLDYILWWVSNLIDGLKKRLKR